jgi:hypothetical protein
MGAAHVSAEESSRPCIAGSVSQLLLIGRVINGLITILIIVPVMLSSEDVTKHFTSGYEPVEAGVPLKIDQFSRRCDSSLARLPIGRLRHGEPTCCTTEYSRV